MQRPVAHRVLEVTDARGEVALAAHGTSRFALRVRSADHTDLLLHDVVLADVPDPWLITMHAGARLHGTIAPVELLYQLRVLAGLPAEGEVGSGVN